MPTGRSRRPYAEQDHYLVDTREIAANRLGILFKHVKGLAMMCGAPQREEEPPYPDSFNASRPAAPAYTNKAWFVALSCSLGAFFCCSISQAEDPSQRSSLPEYRTIPAATPQEQTLTNGLPAAESLTTWLVSHGDSFADRYSALSQINRTNIGGLREPGPTTPGTAMETSRPTRSS